MQRRFSLIFALLLITSALVHADEKDGFKPLFPTDSLTGWKISNWAGIDQPQKVEGEAWKIKDGQLEGLNKRTWLYSEAEYGDYELKFDWKITTRSNAGLGLRFPASGDPAYKGMEIQMVDAEAYYKGNGAENQKTGAIYDEIAPRVDASKPIGQWNTYHVKCKGSQVTIILNGRTVVETDLSKETTARQNKGPALSKRPLKGRIGFQNLNGSVTLKNIQFKKLD